MKNLKRFFLVLVSLLFVQYLFAVSDSVYITEFNIPEYSQHLTQQITENYSKNSNLSQTALNEYQQPLLNPNNPWNDLRKWISEGLEGLDVSSESLTLLENQLLELRVENSEQELLLKQSQELLMNLRQSLEEAQNNVEIAIDRMQDAEDYAFWIEAQNELLKRDAERYRRGSIIGFTIGGVSFGVGIPLLIEGIRSDNRTMLWTGAGTIAVGGTIWALGHFVFQWW